MSVYIHFQQSVRYTLVIRCINAEWSTQRTPPTGCNGLTDLFTMSLSNRPRGCQDYNSEL